MRWAYFAHTLGRYRNWNPLTSLTNLAGGTHQHLEQALPDPCDSVGHVVRLIEVLAHSPVNKTTDTSEKLQCDIER
jgi:hypothetical protein